VQYVIEGVIYEGGIVSSGDDGNTILWTAQGVSIGVYGARTFSLTESHTWARIEVVLHHTDMEERKLSSERTNALAGIDKVLALSHKAKNSDAIQIQILEESPTKMETKWLNSLLVSLLNYSVFCIHALTYAI
jgi:hypothetical protein